MGLNGIGKMTLEPQGDDRWKYTLSIGSGAIKLDQSTTFEDRDGQWRPLSGTDSSLLLIKKTDKKATYDWRSEEHTSELQSLMRISYAVFCLKKKHRRTIQIKQTTRHLNH